MAILSLLLRSLTYTKQAELITMNNWSAYSINLSKKINTPNSLSFNIPADAPHYEKIIVGASLVEFEEEIYIVRSNKITKEDKSIAEISCEHLSSNLAYIRGSYYEYQAEKVSTLVNEVLKNTNWKLGETDIADSNLRHLISSNETVLANLLMIAENFGAVCTFTANSDGVNKVNFYVNKKERGFYITNTKNLQAFTLNYDTTDLVTRLWAWGSINKNTGIQTNILSLTDNKGYIEDYSFYTKQGYSIEYIQSHPELFLMESELKLDDVSDEQTLYDLAVKELDKRKYPKTTLSVNVLDLSQIPKYFMEKPDIFENAILIDETLNLRTEATIIGFDKNYDDDLGMGLDISNVIEYSSFMSDIIDKVDRNDTAIKDIDMGWKDVIEQSRNELTDMVNSGLGGFVLLKPDEILIMDTDDINTCKNIWRWNKNALAFSSNGYHGQYTTGLDMLGRINADIITTGKLNAQIIKTGLLSSLNGTTWINMDNGEFNFANRIKFIDNEFSILLSNGNTVEEEVAQNNAQLNSKIDEVDQKIDNVLDDVGGALADGVISEAEASMIKIKLLDFEKEKISIIEEYTKIYNNIDLLGEAKSNLLNAYSDYIGKCDDLIATINLIIADGEATESEKNNYTAKVNLYNTSYSTFAKRLQEALESINEKKKQDSIEYTKAEINITKDSINQSISSVDGRVSQLSQTLEGFTFDVGQSGGENYVLNGGFKTGDRTGYWDYEYNNTASNCSLNIIDGSNEWMLEGTKTLQIHSEGDGSYKGEYGVAQTIEGLKPNTEYTISYLTASHRAKPKMVITNSTTFEWLTHHNDFVGGAGKDPSGWTRVIKTFNTYDTDTIWLILTIDCPGENAHTWFTNIILNEGKIAQSWKPSSKDGEFYTNTKFEILNDRVTSEISSTNGNISKLQQDLNGFSTYIDNKVDDVQSNLTQTASNLTSNINSVDGRVTSLNQDLSGFKQSVRGSGGANLLRNSRFVKGLSYYWNHEVSNTMSNCSRTIENGSNSPWLMDGYDFLCLHAEGDSNYRGDYGVVQTLTGFKKNTSYTFNCLVASHRAKCKIIILRADTWEWLGSYNDFVGGAGEEIGGYTKVNISFNTQDAGSIWVFLSIDSPSENASLWFTELMLTEGTMEQMWQPHAEEVYSSSVKLDDRSFEVSFNNGTRMECNVDMPLTLVDGATNRQYHALSESGTIVLGGYNGTFPVEAWIQLPAIFKGKQFKVSTSMNQTQGGHSDYEWVQKIRQDIIEYDYANGRFKLWGSWWSRTTANDVYQKELMISWMAIA